MGWREQAELYRANDRAVIESGKPKLMIEEPQTTPAGDTIYLLTSKVPLLDASGVVIGLLGTYLDITERKRAEEFLRQQNATLETLLNAPLDVLALLDRQGIIIQLNQEGIRQYRGTAQTIIGRCVYDILPPDLATERKKSVDRVFETGEPVRFDDEYAGKHLDNAIYPIFNADHTAVEYVAIFAIDITERKRAEQALADSEERYRILAESSPDQIFIISRDDTLRYVNSRALDQFNLPLDQILGKPRTSLFPPETAMAQGVHIKKVFETGTPQQAEETIRFGDVNLWIDTHFVPLKDEKGNVLSVLGVARDISERKRAETALRESEIRFRALIQNSSDIIRILDQHGRILYESSSAERILGYPAGYMIGRRSLEYIHPDDREQVKKDFKDVVDRTNTGTPTEFRVRKADGGYLWVDSIGVNLINTPGINGIVITTRPIQQRKEAEQALNESEERLRLALEGADIASWDWDLASGNVIFSDRFYTMLGYKPGEFLPTYDAWVATHAPR